MEFTSSNAIHNATQGIQLAYDWLENRQDETGINVDYVMNNYAPIFEIDNLKKGVNATTDGETVTIDENYAAKADIVEIAASVIHEATHLTYGGGDKQDEITSEWLAEELRDDYDEGYFKNNKELVNWVYDSYPDLPKDGVNYFA